MCIHIKVQSEENASQKIGIGSQHFYTDKVINWFTNKNYFLTSRKKTFFLKKYKTLSIEFD